MIILTVILTLLALAGGYALWAWWRWHVVYGLTGDTIRRLDDATLAHLIGRHELFGLNLHARLTDEARRRGLKAPPS